MGARETEFSTRGACSCGSYCAEGVRVFVFARRGEVRQGLVYQVEVGGRLQKGVTRSVLPLDSGPSKKWVPTTNHTYIYYTSFHPVWLVWGLEVTLSRGHPANQRWTTRQVRRSLKQRYLIISNIIAY